MIASDSIAMAMVAEWKGIKMPSQPLTDPDVEALLAYIRAEEQRMAKK
jgi:cytochrome c551/c552